MLVRAVTEPGRFAIDAKGVTVFVALLAHAGADWRCWPSLAEIAARTRLGKRTVQRAVELLEQCDLIARHARRDERGRVARMTYSLAPALEQLDLLEPGGPVATTTTGDGSQPVATTTTGRGEADSARGRHGESLNGAGSSDAPVATMANGCSDAPVATVTPHQWSQWPGERTTVKDSEEKTHSARARDDAAAIVDELKRVYPKRSGDQRWADAAKAIRARLREGHTAAEILDGARRYAGYVAAKGESGTQFVKQAATFVGRNLAFLEQWTVPPKQAERRTRGNLEAAATAKNRLFGTDGSGGAA